MVYCIFKTCCFKKKYCLSLAMVIALVGGILTMCLHLNPDDNLLNENVEALIQTEYDTKVCAYDEDTCVFWDIIDGEDVFFVVDGVFI